VADAAACPRTYAGSVFSAQPASSLAAATAPLFSNFGDDLTLWRDGNVVHWSYDGQTVIVSQQPDGAATACFVDAPGLDHVSGSPESAIYRRTAERRYHLTDESCRAMVGDMVAFFSGEREPLFTFTGTRPLEA
jgi:hypothetical protein